MKLKIKRGDEVVVIAGAHRGSRGKVLEILPQRMRVVVEGVNLRKRHQRKSEQFPEGGIIEKETSIHYSNVALGARGEVKPAAKDDTAAAKKVAAKKVAAKKAARGKADKEAAAPKGEDK